MKPNVPFLILASLMTVGAVVAGVLGKLPWEAVGAFVLGSALPVLQKGQEVTK